MSAGRTQSVDKKAKSEAASVPVKKTQADKIWDKIKDLPVNMYALPNQTVKDHVDRLPVTEDKVYLKVRSPAIVPALEESLAGVKLGSGERFDVSNQTNYVVVSVLFDADPLKK